MKKFVLVSSTALLALSTPAFAQDNAAQAQDADTPQAYPESSGLDAPVEDGATAAAVSAAPASTGDPVLDRLNQLEARLRQLETRNAQLEAEAAETQTRVQNVEVRAAKAVQPGAAPTFSDVNGDFTFKPRGTLQVDY